MHERAARAETEPWTAGCVAKARSRLLIIEVRLSILLATQREAQEQQKHGWCVLRCLNGR